MKKSINTVIVGGGQAGISTSYFLKANNVTHIVLEKDRAFSKWYQRWDSFHMNTANWMNALPGAAVEFAPGANRNGLGAKADAIRYFESYLTTVNPPIREHTEVTSVRQTRNGDWQVHTLDSVYDAKNVVICTNPLQKPKFPPVAAELPPTIPQLHSSAYRNPEQIKAEHVLLVGSGNSGVQICEELARSGKFNKLTLAVSDNLTFPLKIAGISIYTLAKWFRLVDLKPNSWLGRKLFQSDRGDPTIPPSPEQLKKIHGVNLVGKVSGANPAGIRCSDGKTIPFEGLGIVWCTGFQPWYGFIEPLNKNAAFDADGQPVHKRGVVAAAPGLYFVGLRYQYTIGSHSVYGVGRDAQFVAQHITSNKLI